MSQNEQEQQKQTEKTESSRQKAIESSPKDKQFRPDKAGDNYRTK